MKERDQNIFITGIDTNIGKTVVSTIVVKALNASYWKPIQCGDLNFSDSDFVREKTNCNVFPESIRLTNPLSANIAAKRQGVKISLDDFILPARVDTKEKIKAETPIIIEGAGGLLHPLNEKDFIIDLIKKLKTPVILVVKNYLGSLNHTFLSIVALKKWKIPILGIIFNGPANLESEETILKFSGLPKLLHVPPIDFSQKDLSLVDSILKTKAFELRENLRAKKDKN